MASSTQTARVPANRPVATPAAPRPKPEANPSKFVIKLVGTIPQ